jgi:hypothetical protein
MRNFAAFIILALGLSACGFSFGRGVIKGSGKIVSEERKVSDFHAVDFSGSGIAEITQGDTEGITIEADDNILPYIRTEVVDGVLKVGFKPTDLKLGFNPSKEIRYTLKVIKLKKISTSGAVDVSMDGLTTGDMFLNLSGAGSVKLDHLTADSLTSDVSGAGDITLSGKVQRQDVKLSGAGKYHAENLESSKASLNGSGSVDAILWVHDKLTVDISGSGKVEYYGSPALTQQVSGAAKIKAYPEK